ncbi:PilZ domain-containing protein [Klenkia marina]|uniref:PilZ domain-containing protein n=1 Tax=Klenkia marina TaxID=1960309 RepID=A0A1G4XWN8_9ACTN|nr:PilZ domain-containing protein [Klenkia marina]SCX45579.1 PilZ domain-containing protein [Klenkia marina]
MFATESDDDRPSAGDRVEVVGIGGAPQATTTVDLSRPSELVLGVGVDARGRKVRLGLGSMVLVWWVSPGGAIRYRPHVVADVRGGGFPTWVLQPAGAASEGDRRASPRVAMAVPVGLVTPVGMLLGETTDVSEGGLRAMFGAAPTAGHGDVVLPFPEAGDTVVLALVLGGSRVELSSRARQAKRVPDGRRLLRASFEEVPDEVRLRLRSTTSQEIGRQLVTGRR